MTTWVCVLTFVFFTTLRFLYQEFGDAELMQMFLPFGNVISSKVINPSYHNHQKLSIFSALPNVVAKDKIKISTTPNFFLNKTKCNFKLFKTDIETNQVFIDRATNQSKCFGFVSFNNQSSAQAAIQVRMMMMFKMTMMLAMIYIL